MKMTANIKKKACRDGVLLINDAAAVALFAIVVLLAIVSYIHLRRKST